MIRSKSYKTYKFKNQDPAIKTFKQVVKSRQLSVPKIADDSGVRVKTIRKWMNGETKRPLHATITAALRATGNDFLVVLRND